MLSRTLFLLCLLFSLAACASSSSPKVRVRISGGERITIDLKNGDIVGAESKEIKVRMGGLVTNAKDKQACYVFILEFKVGDVPQSIKIEDVTDEVAQVFVEDHEPKLDARIWNWKSAPLDGDAKSLQWVREIDDSFRVCRFTVVLKDGRKLSQYQSAYYPAFVKARLRKELGGEP